MAFALLGLLHPRVVRAAQRVPLWADLSGGMKSVRDLKAQVDGIRARILAQAAINAAVFADAQLDDAQRSLPSDAERTKVHHKLYYDRLFVIATSHNHPHFYLCEIFSS